MNNIISFLDVESYIARVYAGKRCAVKPFYLSFDFGDLLALASSTTQQKIPSNADFILMRMAYSQQDAFVAGGTIQFQDGSTNELFYSASMPIMSVADNIDFGLADQSTYRRLAGNSLISGTLTAPSAAALNNAVITMAGVLVYVYTGQ